MDVPQGSEAELALASWIGGLLGSKVSLSRLAGDELGSPQVYVVHGDDSRFVAKRYTDSTRLRADVAGYRIARDFCSVSVPAVVNADFERGFVLVEAVAGTKLADLLRAGADTIPDVAYRVGLATSLLHSGTVPPELVGGPLLVGDLLRCEASRLASMAAKVGVLPPRGRWSSLAGRLTRVSRKLDAMLTDSDDKARHAISFSFVHGDLSSENVIVDPHSWPWFIDFEWSCISDPWLDLARLYSRGFVARDLSKPFTTCPPSHLWEMFCRGYGRDIDTGSKRFRAALTYGLSRTINYYSARVASNDPYVAERSLTTVARVAASLDNLL